PLAQSPQPGAAGPVIAERRGAHREETREACGARSCQVRGTLTQGWPCDGCGHLRRIRALDHEPDWASVRADGKALYPGWQSVPREQWRETRFVAVTICS